MSQSRFSLSWSAHNTNICTGLSSLQQNGELVDMTLAADGHYVKVHQVIMALASPYIKDLITTAACPHPIIFLNRISYITLSAILEYIYTGEVLIPMDNLSELIEAGRELHIKGLEDMNLDSETKPKFIQPQSYDSEIIQHKQEENECDEYYEVLDTKNGEKYMIYSQPNNTKMNTADEILPDDSVFDETIQVDEEGMQTDATENSSVHNIVIESMTSLNSDPKSIISPTMRKSSNSDNTVMQYTVSNQGSLQLILNRFVYFLKHTKRCGTRQWRCVDYLSARCPALLVTNDNVVLQRVGAHVHPFHDKKILKKVNAGAIFSAINEALEDGNTKKDRRKYKTSSEGAIN